MTADQEVAVLYALETEPVTGMVDVVMPKPLLQPLGQPRTAGFAEAAAREFARSGFAGVPASPDVGCTRACIDDLAQRDA
ncbi:hypothetical protein AYJ54_05110 [Bradyrhizobium centrolobii]|uniref:Uncharacterized protein n=1 Tax=Bradyrhizobium centrolobii TaxID=1505087 RepID=A0A176ZAZ7_9BRAD|nr:hypothetical protein AYJ54_05110 [Bradyrhizobium centrolobii]